MISHQSMIRSRADWDATLSCFKRICGCAVVSKLFWDFYHVILFFEKSSKTWFANFKELIWISYIDCKNNKKLTKNFFNTDWVYLME